MSKKFWIIWAITNIIMGICSYIIMGFGYMIAWAAAGANPRGIYIILALFGLVLFIIMFIANKMLYRGFSERSEEPISPKVMTGGNLLAWAVAIICYLIMASLTIS
ncbi:MAG: hypothetical protein J1E61_03165 [Lachnospiraceae bacterium]|nr:hypothetical protein [Lachnospiraceae bacterium]